MELSYCKLLADRGKLTVHAVYVNYHMKSIEIYFFVKFKKVLRI